MMKAKRRAAILRILAERSIATQEELAEALRAEGFAVTQATVSRDIAELGLVKTPTGDGSYRWQLPPLPTPKEVLNRAKRAFADYVVGVDRSANLVVVRTLPGAAQAVAVTLDALGWSEMLATVAGDDTILVVAAETAGGAEKAAAVLMRKFEELME